MQTGAQSFADRFFGGETARQARELAPALLNLAFGIDTMQETLAVVLVDFADAVNFDNVDAHRDIDPLWGMKRRRKTSHSGGTKEPVGNRYARTPHEGGKDEWLVFFAHS